MRSWARLGIIVSLLVPCLVSDSDKRPVIAQKTSNRAQGGERLVGKHSANLQPNNRPKPVNHVCTVLVC